MALTELPTAANTSPFSFCRKNDARICVAVQEDAKDFSLGNQLFWCSQNQNRFAMPVLIAKEFRHHCIIAECRYHFLDIWL